VKASQLTVLNTGRAGGLVAASVRFDEAGRYAQIPTHGKENRITHRNVVLYESVNEVVTQ